MAESLPMHNAAIFLILLSTVVSLFGGNLRDGFVYSEDRPANEDFQTTCRAQKRLCIGFFVMAGLGLALAIVNALAFAIFRLSDADAAWTAAGAAAWAVAVLVLFVRTFGAMRKARALLGSW